jgi:ornithine carbamoyltransferase
MKIPELKTKHLKKVTDITPDEMIELFEFTKKIKKMQHEGIRHPFLDGQVLAMIFEKSSTRTRVSFEAGMYQLGGSAIFLSKNDIQLQRGEPVTDTARVLSRYVDGIMIRTFSHNVVDTLAEYSTVPVINGLSDDFHPCQALADFFTMYEIIPSLGDVKLAYIGDGNNMAHSLLLAGAMAGSHVVIASPDGYQPKLEIVNEAKAVAQLTGAKIEVTTSVEEAAKDADFLLHRRLGKYGPGRRKRETKKRL